MKKISANQFQVIKQLLLQKESPLKLKEEQWENLVENEKINKSNAIWIINEQAAGKLENCPNECLTYLIQFFKANYIKQLSKNAAQTVAKEPQDFKLTPEQVIALLEHENISSENPVDISKHQEVFNNKALKNLLKEQADALAKAYGTEEDQKLVMTQNQHAALGQNKNLSENVLSKWRENQSINLDK